MSRSRRRGGGSKAKGGVEQVDDIDVDPRIKLKEMGNKAFGDKKYDDAIELFTRAIHLPDPSLSIGSPVSMGSAPLLIATLYSNRSACHAEMLEWEKALNDANTTIELAPEWPKGYVRRGVAYKGLMNYQKAHEAFSQGLKLDQSDPGLQKSVSEIEEMLEEMKLSQDEITKKASENPEEDKFQTMINWLVNGKARFPSLYLQYYSEDYRGVHALTRVAKDSIVLEVPLSHIMTSEVAKQSHIGQAIINSGIELNSTHTYLAAYLLQEKYNAHSFWKPYINILPVHYRNMPIFFTQDELSYLKGSFSLGKISDRHAELKEEYDNLCRHIESFSVYTLDEFIWARSVVITRIFGLNINGNKTDGLVPMADMLNHKRPRETSWTYDDSRGAFTITTLRHMNRGEQIYDSYGRKCNSRFFVNYGFSLEENADNQAVLYFTLPLSDPHYNMKIRLLTGQKLGSISNGQPKRFQIPTDYSEDVTKECFSFLRFVHAKDSELMLLSSNEKFDIKKIEPISIRNEMEVIQDLAIAAHNSMQQFETTIEQDEALLKTELHPNIRNCILMRRGEKQVLQYYIDLAKEIQPLISMPWKDFKRLAAKCYGGKTKFDSYITSVIVPLIKSDH